LTLLLPLSKFKILVISSSFCNAAEWRSYSWKPNFIWLSAFRNACEYFLHWFSGILISA